MNLLDGWAINIGNFGRVDCVGQNDTASVRQLTKIAITSRIVGVRLEIDVDENIIKALLRRVIFDMVQAVWARRVFRLCVRAILC